MKISTSISRSKIAASFDTALRQEGIIPKSVRFEGSRVAFLLSTAGDLEHARALLTSAGCQDLDDFDLTETGRGHMLLARVA